MNLRLGKPKDGDGDPKDCEGSEVLSWINRSMEPAAIGVHCKPHPVQHYQSNSVGYTQERHTVITSVWGPKN